MKANNYPPRSMERFIRYKWVCHWGMSPFQNYDWPIKNLPAKWEPVISGVLVQCGNGYHTCKHNPSDVWWWRTAYLSMHILLKLEVSDQHYQQKGKEVWRYARVLENLGPLTRNRVRALDFSGRPE